MRMLGFANRIGLLVDFAPKEEISAQEALL